jgi:hypothetical protein
LLRLLLRQLTVERSTIIVPLVSGPATFLGGGEQGGRLAARDRG